MFYTRRSTQNVRFISCDGYQLYAFKGLGIVLEVEGVPYIVMHRGVAAHMLGPPPSRSGDLKLERGDNVSL